MYSFFPTIADSGIPLLIPLAKAVKSGVTL